MVNRAARVSGGVRYVKHLTIAANGFGGIERFFATTSQLFAVVRAVVNPGATTQLCLGVVIKLAATRRQRRLLITPTDWPSPATHGRQRVHDA